MTGGQVSGTGRETDSVPERAERRKERGEEEARKMWVSVAIARPGEGSRGLAVAPRAESARLGEGCRPPGRPGLPPEVWGRGCQWGEEQRHEAALTHQPSRQLRGS